MDLQQAKEQPDSWSAFVYANGYNSGAYKKTDNFKDYTSCEKFAKQQAHELGEVVWECGLNCWFDSSRQGFQCAKMKRD